MNHVKPKKSPVVWMNVTTSANWKRPPVGVVRVEQALCAELAKVLGPDRFKQCIWMDNEFVEWIPDFDYASTNVQKAVDLILPRTQAFDIPRKFLAHALSSWTSVSDLNGAEEGKKELAVTIPIDEISSHRPSAGDILLSVGLDWDHPYPDYFFGYTKTRGIKIITCCYDIIPVLFPQYCVGDVASRFKEYCMMLTWGSSAVLCISEQSKRDYLSLCEDIGLPRRPTYVIPLGDNVPGEVGEISAHIRSLTSAPFILFVSTIERRKNHEVLYRAYHLLCRSGRRDILPKMVFVGMPGWGVGDLLKDMELDPLTEGLFVQLNHVNDAELKCLYKHALFCVYPSLYEGWGLPVGEALALGKAVLASGQGSLPEVGGDLVRYAPPWNPKLWADAILDWLTSPKKVKKIERRIAKEYSVKTWSDTARVVLNVINDLLTGVGADVKILYPGYDFYTRVGLHNGAYLLSTGRSGYLLYGPYRYCQAGKYRVSAFDLPELRTSGHLLVDFVANLGRKVLWQGLFEIDKAKAEDTRPLFEFEVCVDEDLADYELRCTVDAANVTLTRVVITSI